MEKKNFNRFLVRRSSFEKTTLVSHKGMGVKAPRYVLTKEEPPRCLLRKISVVN